MTLHTYHHLCSTLLLSTPYTLASLPRRAPPAADRAYILPLPDLNRASSAAVGTATIHDSAEGGGGGDGETGDGEIGGRVQATLDAEARGGGEGGGEAMDASSAPSPNASAQHIQKKKDVGGAASTMIYPSLLSPYFRPARKLLVVRREDGYEVRRVWRCGRCGGGVGYEIVGQGGNGGAEAEGVEREGMSYDLGEGGKVLYLVEGGLVETGCWAEEVGGEVG